MNFLNDSIKTPKWKYHYNIIESENTSWISFHPDLKSTLVSKQKYSKEDCLKLLFHSHNLLDFSSLLRNKSYFQAPKRMLEDEKVIIDYSLIN